MFTQKKWLKANHFHKEIFLNYETKRFIFQFQEQFA